MTQNNSAFRLFPCPESKVLDLFGVEGMILTVSEIGERTGLDKRTVRRIIRSFEELGVVRKLDQRIGNTDLYEFNSELISGILREINALVVRRGT